MGISFVSGASAETTSISSMPTHVAGDLLVIEAFDDGATTIPTLPSGWTNLATLAGTSCAGRLAYKWAASSSETATGFTSATGLILGVWRGVGALGAVGSNAGQSPGHQPTRPWSCRTPTATTGSQHSVCTGR